MLMCRNIFLKKRVLNVHFSCVKYGANKRSDQSMTAWESLSISAVNVVIII